MNLDDKIVLKGYIGRKMYDDAKTYNKGYKVYTFYPHTDYQHLVALSSYGNISITGVMPDLIEAKEYTIECQYDKGAKFPNSYILKNITWDKGQNVSVDETVKFLKSIGISNSVVESIVKTYPNIIDLITNERIDEIDVKSVKGLGVKRLETIIQKVNENYRFFDIMTEYSDMGLTMKMVKSLYDQYTNIEMIRKAMDDNPYECLCKIARVGFKTADACIITRNEAFKKSPFRMKECIKYLLKQNEEKGNTWISIPELHHQAMDITPDCMMFFAKELQSNEDIYINVETKRVAFKKTFACEFEIAYRVHQLVNQKKHYNFDVSKYTTSREGFPLSEKQKEILPLLNTHSICVLMGYGGTGKSTSSKAVVDMIIDNGKRVMLLAPTGRASKVLNNMTGHDASTIHRGLRLKSEEELNQQNPVSEEFVICDEATMADIWLMRSLLRAIDPQFTTLLFVCDPAQLASVGCGNVISDIIQSGVVPTVFLDEVFRYGEGGLSYVATEIREGAKYLDVLDERKIINFGINKDYSFLRCAKEETLQTVMLLYQRLLANGMDKNEIILLSAYNKGEMGTYNLNNLIQAYVNPALEEDIMTRKIGDITIAFREGDRVIQIRNNYKAPKYVEDRSQIKMTKSGKIDRPTTKVFNGDDGVVVKVTEELMVVDFSGELIEYEKKDLGNLLLGYAISVHKSQGSTFDNAILVTPISHKFFTKRNLLYVGVTRARKRVFHVGDVGTVLYALKQSENIMRNTFLCDLLKSDNLESQRVEYKETEDDSIEEEEN